MKDALLIIALVAIFAAGWWLGYLYGANSRLCGFCRKALR